MQGDEAIVSTSDAQLCSEYLAWPGLVGPRRAHCAPFSAKTAPRRGASEAFPTPFIDLLAHGAGRCHDCVAGTCDARKLCTVCFCADRAANCSPKPYSPKLFEQGAQLLSKSVLQSACLLTVLEGTRKADVLWRRPVGGCLTRVVAAADFASAARQPEQAHGGATDAPPRSKTQRHARHRRVEEAQSGARCSGRRIVVGAGHPDARIVVAGDEAQAAE